LGDEIEFAENPEPRCACVLLLDTSSSMQGAKINALNEGLRVFKQELTRDLLACRRVEVAVVTFDSQVRVVQDFVTADQFAPSTLRGLNFVELFVWLSRSTQAVAQAKTDEMLALPPAGWSAIEQ